MLASSGTRYTRPPHSHLISPRSGVGGSRSRRLPGRSGRRPCRDAKRPHGPRRRDCCDEAVEFTRRDTSRVCAGDAHCQIARVPGDSARARIGGGERRGIRCSCYRLPSSEHRTRRNNRHRKQRNGCHDRHREHTARAALPRAHLPPPRAQLRALSVIPAAMRAAGRNRAVAHTRSACAERETLDPGSACAAALTIAELSPRAAARAELAAMS